MTAAGNTDRSRWVTLVVLCVGMLMIVLDATIVNVALPSIQTDLGFSQSSLAWVVNAYLIAFGGLLLLAGRFGDLISRRTVFLAGLAVFTGASLLCGVANSQEMPWVSAGVGIDLSFKYMSWCHWTTWTTWSLSIVQAVSASLISSPPSSQTGTQV